MFACRKKFLHGLDILAIRLEQSGEGVPECMPADLALECRQPLQQAEVRPIQRCPASTVVARVLAGLAKTQSSGFG